MFYGKGIEVVYNEEATKALMDHEDHLKYYAEKIGKEITPAVREEFEKHLMPPWLTWDDVINYKFEDYWQDGMAKNINDINITYGDNGSMLKLLDKFGIDFICMVGLELAKLTDLPFNSPNRKLYGHSAYIFPHWGTVGNQAESLNIVFYVPDGGADRQRTFECYIPAYPDIPKHPGSYCGNTHYETEEYYATSLEKKIIYKHDLRLGNIFNSLHLNYYDETTVTTPKGRKIIPKHGSIQAREVKQTVRAVAVHIFDKYYSLKPVPRRV